jgi:8-oxo-dGTP pyrophosphatase MutT (NUDIX family)
VVPLRDGEHGLEVLLLRRSSGGTFGGVWVFPGGQIDGADAVGVPGESNDSEVGAARRAAVREAQEEAGLDLDANRLVTLSFWLTPPQAPRRFATWFFLAPAAEQPAVVVDEREIHEHRWYTPAAAMAARDAGKIELVAPTFTTLWWLAQRRDVASALADGGARPPERFIARLAFGAGGVRATLWEGDAGYRDGDLDRPGARRRLWIAPQGWWVEITGS